MSAWQKISAIALNTYRESVRDKILYSFVFFAFMITVLGLLLGSLSVGQDVRILEDIGLFAIAFIGGIIAVFAGTNLVYKEIERRTIYLIFTKPITGWQFILGKYLGLSLCVLAVVAAMGLFLAALVFFLPSGHSLSSASALDLQRLSNLILSLALIYLELIFVTATATFFSTFASPVMSVVFTLGMWLIAHLSDSLTAVAKLSTNPAIKELFHALYWILPDLASLTRTRFQLVTQRSVDTELITFLVCYLCSYVVLLLCLSALITERKEFN